MGRFSDSSYNILETYYDTILDTVADGSQSSYLAGPKRSISADGGIGTILYQKTSDGDYVAHKFKIQDIKGNNFRFSYEGMVSTHSEAVGLQTGEELYFRKDSYFQNWLTTNSDTYKDYINTNKTFIYFGKIYPITGSVQYNIVFEGLKDYVENALPDNNRTDNLLELLKLFYDQCYQDVYSLTKNLLAFIDAREVNLDHLYYLADRANITIDQDKIDTELLLREFVDNLPYWLKRKGTYSAYYIIWKLLAQNTSNVLNIYERWVEWCLPSIKTGLLIPGPLDNFGDFEDHHIWEYYGQQPSGGASSLYYDRYNPNTYPDYSEAPTGTCATTTHECTRQYNYEDADGEEDDGDALTTTKYNLQIDAFAPATDGDLYLYEAKTFDDQFKHCVTTNMDSDTTPSAGMFVWLLAQEGNKNQDEFTDSYLGIEYGYGIPTSAGSLGIYTGVDPLRRYFRIWEKPDSETKYYQTVTTGSYVADQEYSLGIDRNWENSFTVSAGTSAFYQQPQLGSIEWADTSKAAEQDNTFAEIYRFTGDGGNSISKTLWASSGIIATDTDVGVYTGYRDNAAKIYRVEVGQMTVTDSAAGTSNVWKLKAQLFGTDSSTTSGYYTTGTGTDGVDWLDVTSLSPCAIDSDITSDVEWTWEMFRDLRIGNITYAYAPSANCGVDKFYKRAYYQKPQLDVSIYPDANRKESNRIEKITHILHQNETYDNFFPVAAVKTTETGEWTGDIQDTYLGGYYTTSLGSTGYMVPSPHYKVEIDLSSEPLGEDYIISEDLIDELMRYWAYIKPVSKVAWYHELLSPVAKLDILGESQSLYDPTLTAICDTKFVGQSTLTPSAAASAAGDLYYLTADMSQSTSKDEWLFEHGLDTDELLIQAYEPNGYMFVPDHLEKVDIDTTKLDWSAAVRGTAYAASVKHYRNIESYTQTTAATAWDIVHNNVIVSAADLPIIQVWNYDLTENIIPDEIYHISSDEVIIYFSEPVSGHAFLRDADYVHLTTDSVPSTTWTVNHNLDAKAVIVQATDNLGYVIQPQDVYLNTRNQCTLTFGEAVSGAALIIGFQRDFEDTDTESALQSAIWKVGDGYTDLFEAEDATNLASVLASGNIDSYAETSTDPSGSYILKFHVPRNEEGTYNEMGIFDSSQNLLFYTSMSDLHKPEDIQLDVIYRISKE